MIIGYSGCGKDTQAGLIQKLLEEREGNDSVLYVYTGAHLREAEKLGTHTARLITEKIMRIGAKAPDFLAIWAWANDIIANLKEDHHLILSSSPRTVLESKVMDDAFEFYGRKNVFPIYLNVARKEAFDRLKARGRFDDTDEAINNRLDYFEKFVLPAVEYYRKESKNKLIEIDGNPRDPQKIHEDVKRALGL